MDKYLVRSKKPQSEGKRPSRHPDKVKDVPDIENSAKKAKLTGDGTSCFYETQSVDYDSNQERSRMNIDRENNHSTTGIDGRKPQYNEQHPRHLGDEDITRSSTKRSIQPVTQELAVKWRTIKAENLLCDYCRLYTNREVGSLITSLVIIFEICIRVLIIKI